jgi:hypothetical protein
MNEAGKGYRRNKACCSALVDGNFKENYQAI